MTVFAIFYSFIFLFPEIPPEASFRFFVIHEDVHISLAKQENGSAWVLARTELPYSVKQISRVLKNFESYGDIFDDSLKEASVIERISDSQVRMHQVWDLPFPFRNRDSVIEYRFEETPEGAVLQWQDAVMPGDPSSGVRLEKVQGMTKLTPLSDSKTEILFMYYGELGENFPDWAREISYREEPLNCFRGIRKALSKEEAQDK